MEGGERGKCGYLAWGAVELCSLPEELHRLPVDEAGDAVGLVAVPEEGEQASLLIAEVPRGSSHPAMGRRGVAGDDWRAEAGSAEQMRSGELNWGGKRGGQGGLEGWGTRGAAAPGVGKGGRSEAGEGEVGKEQRWG